MADVNESDVARAKDLCVKIFGDLLSEGSAEWQHLVQGLAAHRGGEALVDKSEGVKDE